MSERRQDSSVGCLYLSSVFGICALLGNVGSILGCILLFLKRTCTVMSMIYGLSKELVQNLAYSHELFMRSNRQTLESERNFIHFCKPSVIVSPLSKDPSSRQDEW